MKRTLLQRKVLYGVVAGVIGQLPGIIFIGDVTGILPDIVRMWTAYTWMSMRWETLPYLILAASITLSLFLILISFRIAEMKDSYRRRRAFRRLWFYGLVVTVIGPTAVWIIIGSIDLLSI